jgi:hypothetical protein
VSANITSVGPTCGAAGVINIAVSGGEIPYRFSLIPSSGDPPTPFQLGSTLRGIPFGTHTVIVVDNRGNQLQFNATVPYATNGVNITGVTIRNTTGPGASDGSAALRIINGGSGLSFSATNTEGTVYRLQSTGNFTSLPSGIYDASVTDGIGCSSSAKFSIYNAVTVNAQATRAACSSTSFGTGQITATFAFGAMPYNVTLGDTNVLLFQTQYTFEDLLPGTYNVSVVDANQISRSFSVVVPSYTLSLGDRFWYPRVVPYGNSFSNVFFSFVNQPFEWRLDEDATWLTPFAPYTVGAGNHTLHIRDPWGCTEQYPFTVYSPFWFTSAADPVADTRCGGSKYRVRATAIGGSPPYRWKIEGVSDWQDDPVWENVPPGPHMILGESYFAGQTGRSYNNLYLNQIARSNPISIQRVVVDPSSVTELGSITLFVSDPVSDPLLRYELDGVSAGMSPAVYGVGPGLHSVRIIDSQGCSSDTSEVFVPSRLLASVTASTDRCYSLATGTVTISISGGVRPYVVAVDGVSRGSFAAGVLANLNAGDHVITISDSSPTTQAVDLSVTIGTLPQMIAGGGSTFAPDDLSEGLIWLNSTGRSTAYRYRVTPGQAVFQVNNTFSVGVGSWVMDVTDENGCLESKTFTMSRKLTVSISDILPSCPSVSTASATINADGGTLPYSFRLDGISIASPYLSGLTAGEHVVVATDSSLPPQSASISFVIGEYPPIQLTFTVTPMTDVGAPDGSLTIDAVKFGYPSTTFSYNLDGLSQPSNVFTSLSAGQKSLLVSDSDGCSVSAVADISARLLYVVAQSNPLCYGKASGSITVGYSSSFFEPVVVTLVGVGQLGSDLTANGLVAGTYRFELEDSSSPPLTSRLDLFLTDPSPLAASISVSSYDPYSTLMYTWLSGFGGSPPYIHTLVLYARGSSGAQSQSAPFSAYHTRVADVDWQVTDSQGCSVFGSVYGRNPVVLKQENNSPACRGSTGGSFVVSASGGLPPYRWIIEPLSGQSSVPGWASAGYGLMQATNAEAGSYLVSAFDSSSGNRTGSLTVVVSGINIRALVSQYGGDYPNSGYIIISPLDWSVGTFIFAVEGPIYRSSLDSGSFYNLPTGDYIVRLQSRRFSCTFTQQVRLTQRLAASINYGGNKFPTCGKSNGVAKIDAVGGLAPLSFIWSGVAYSSSVRNDVPAGSHAIVVRDSSEPPSQVSLLLNFPESETLSLSVATRETDSSIQFGTIRVYVRNAAGAISITIDGLPASLGYNSGFQAGEHQVVAVDGAGCSVTETAIVRMKSTEAVIEEVNQALCCGQTAAARLRAHPSWEYARADQEIWQADPWFRELTPGRLYEFWVREATDPADFASTTLIPNQPSCFQIASVVPLKRKTAAGGTASVSVRGLSSYFVSVDGGTKTRVDTSFAYIDVPAPEASLLQRTAHNVSITSAAGCTDWRTVTLDPPIVVEYDATNPKCFGEQTGTISLKVSGSVPPLTILDGRTGLSSNSTFFSGIGAGNVLFTVSDSGIPQSSVTVNTYLAFSPRLYMFNQELMFGANLTLVARPIGGTEPFTFTFVPVANVSARVTQLVPQYSVATAGTVNVTVVDSLGCQVTSQIFVYQPRTLSIPSRAQLPHFLNSYSFNSRWLRGHFEQALRDKHQNLHCHGRSVWRLRLLPSRLVAI